MPCIWPVCHKHLHLPRASRSLKEHPTLYIVHCLWSEPYGANWDTGTDLKPEPQCAAQPLAQRATCWPWAWERGYNPTQVDRNHSLQRGEEESLASRHRGQRGRRSLCLEWVRTSASFFFKGKKISPCSLESDFSQDRSAWTLGPTVRYCMYTSGGRLRIMAGM